MSGSRGERDHYATLGAGRDEAREEIERRYKRLARRLHPDRGGDEEEMKALNEAWGVLGDEAARRAYDARRPRPPRAYRAHTPSSSPAARADPVSGRILGAWMCIMLGLVLLFLVRVHYVRFLWPLALLAVFIIIAGIFQAHAVMRAIRETFALSHPVRRFTMIQEMVFWVVVCGGGYGVYFVLTYFK